MDKQEVVGIDCKSWTVRPLSSRGQAQADKADKAVRLHQLMRDSYHAERNVDGVVNLGVAENTLMHEELRTYFEGRFCLTSEDFTYGDGLTGTSRLSNAVSSFLNSYFKPYRSVEPCQIVVGAGLMPLMSQVARVVADPGDGILVATPYYQGFDVSLAIQNGVIPVGVPVPASDMFTLAEVACLERYMQEVASKGTMKLRAVIFCNPHNPLGRSYPSDVITAYCRFCEAHDLHLLSDEIYGLSTFPSEDVPHPEPFISVLSLDLNSLGVNPSRVHVFYGMSKDFNANGFRAGVLISQSNPVLIRSLTVASIFMTVASPTDTLWAALLTDATYLPSFLRTNRTKMREAYEHMTSWLKFHGLPYLPSSAGHFLMVDWRPVLADVDRYAAIIPIREEQSMQEREAALHVYLLACKVLIMPGATYHATEGGWFRMTFTVRRDYVDVALRRIEEALEWAPWCGEACIRETATNVNALSSEELLPPIIGVKRKRAASET